MSNDKTPARSQQVTLEEWMRRTLDQITLADLLQRDCDIPELLRARLSNVVFGTASPSLITMAPSHNDQEFRPQHTHNETH